MKELEYQEFAKLIDSELLNSSISGSFLEKLTETEKPLENYTFKDALHELNDLRF